MILAYYIGEKYDEALRVAKEFGYREPKWWKPGTWSNYLILTP